MNQRNRMCQNDPGAQDGRYRLEPQTRQCADPMGNLSQLMSCVNKPAGIKSEVNLEAIAKEIFEHVRNLVVCATLMALGMVARNRSQDLLGSSLFKGAIGWGVIAVATALTVLNLRIGVMRLRPWKRRWLWSALLLVLYLLIAVRLVEVMAILRLQANQ